MNDAVRRWLDLQRDLGGAEAYLDQAIEMPAPPHDAPGEPGPTVVRRAAQPAKAAAPPAERVPRVTPAPISDRAPEREWRVVPTGDPDAVWRKALPPIPGPGFAARSPAGPPTPPWHTLDEVATTIASCIRCPLCRSRTKTVPGEGDPSARLMCVGEGPGESEDLSGRPFVGRAGEVLDKILDLIETPRPSVYIANVVKCRPPKNRVPLPDEREACMPYLHRQIELVRPKVILALGATAAEALLGMKKPLGDLRLRVHRYNDIPLVVTYHPAALLRNPNWKRPAWDDVRIARQLLDVVD